MTAPVHTRGPWAVARLDRRVVDPALHPNIVAATGAFAIMATDPPMSEDAGFEHANARLIAAAPDLLDAADRALSQLSMNVCPACGASHWKDELRGKVRVIIHEADCGISAMHRAIAKARGTA